MLLLLSTSVTLLTIPIVSLQIVHQTVGDRIAIKSVSARTIPRAMPRTEAVPARRGTEANAANSSARRTVLDRIVPRFANARTVANVIRFPASATVRLVSRGLCELLIDGCLGVIRIWDAN